jgi:hypothetical protein
VPADEIENWLNDEIDAGIAPSSVHRHYRTLRRVLQVAIQKRKSSIRSITISALPPKSSSFWNNHSTRFTNLDTGVWCGVDAKRPAAPRLRAVRLDDRAQALAAPLIAPAPGGAIRSRPPQVYRGERPQTR